MFFVTTLLIQCKALIVYRIISLRGEISVNEISLISPLLAKPWKWAVWYMCVKGTYSASISTIFLFDFGTVRTVWHFCFVFHFIITKLRLFLLEICVIQEVIPVWIRYTSSQVFLVCYVLFVRNWYRALISVSHCNTMHLLNHNHTL